MESNIRLKLLDLVEQLRLAILAEDAPTVPTPYEPPPAPTPAPATPRRAITSVRLENQGTTSANVPFTFGHVFAPGDLPAGMALDGLQMDVKATHPDGSVRHAVLSGAAYIAQGTGRTVPLVAVPRVAEDPKAGVSVDKIDASVALTVDGVAYLALADAALLGGQGHVWLHGPVAVEMGVRAPLIDASGNEHPHLSVWFACRWYPGAKNARVEVVIENAWAYEPNPRNFTYTAVVTVAGKVAAHKKNFTHYHHARWRCVAWTGEAPAVHVRHDTAYLIASRAVPNYDQSVTIPEAALASLAKGWDGPKTEPMDVGMPVRSMGTTGGRPDIGLLPGWAVSYLLSMDPRAARATLGTADLSGSWSAHYRDKASGYPVSLLDHPYITIVGRQSDTRNPTTGQFEAVPKLDLATSATPNKLESSHQPDLAYLPYLLTGEYYYLEELQFWATWNIASTTPGYRGFQKGLVHRTQLRGQAWCLRSLLHAAYITPDAHPLKKHFEQWVANNLEWYNETYTNNPDANKLGVISGYGHENVNYENDTSVAPWQNDFFASVVGRAVELGYDQARPLLGWVAKFAVGRMVDPGVCWLAAANYTYKVRDSATSPLYDSMARAYVATVGPELASLPCGDSLAAALGNKPGDMGGYPTSAVGYPSNLQPALAYAAGTGDERAARAWQVFMSRSLKPNYGKDGAQFAIVPRGAL